MQCLCGPADGSLANLRDPEIILSPLRIELPDRFNSNKLLEDEENPLDSDTVGFFVDNAFLAVAGLRSPLSSSSKSCFRLLPQTAKPTKAKYTVQTKKTYHGISI